MIAALTVIKIISSIAPKRILDKHVLSLKNVVAMNLNTEELVEAFGLSIAALCGMWLLGNYGAEGNFYSGNNNYEKPVMIAIIALGNGSLFGELRVTKLKLLTALV